VVVTSYQTSATWAPPSQSTQSVIQHSSWH
jgi:hypothetical protein